VIRGFFELIKDINIQKDNELIYYSLIHLDGILEDSRSRVKFYLEIMNDFKSRLDLVEILINFISKSKERYHRDIASHILVLLIDAEKFEKIEKNAMHFLDTLMIQKEKGFSQHHTENIITINALSFAILTMVKKNELAQKFCSPLGFKILNDFLEQACLENAQIAYNVVATLWILSYHEFSHKFIEDYTIGIIERTSKILDFFSWEKIVRILLMFFDNIKMNPVCQEHLSDIDCLNLVIKLKNRHWVDEDINKLLD
jgi:hypothetical protein